MPGTTSTPVKTLFVEQILVLSQLLNALNLLIVSEIFYDLDILGQVVTPFIAHSKGSPEKGKTFIVAVVVVLQLLMIITR